MGLFETTHRRSPGVNAWATKKKSFNLGSTWLSSKFY